MDKPVWLTLPAGTLRWLSRGQGRLGSEYPVRIEEAEGTPVILLAMKARILGPSHVKTLDRPTRSGAFFVVETASEIEYLSHYEPDQA